MKNIKKVAPLLIVIIVLVGGYYLFFRDKQIEEQRNGKQEEISESEMLIKELVEKYQAITNWEDDLTYTLQVQEKLIIDKPILFKGYVDDIFNRDEKTFIHFSSSFFSEINYILELECEKSIVNTILTQKLDNEIYLGFFDEYAVIASIQEVIKPIFALEGSALSEDEVEISVESSDLFIAKGVCIDIVNIEDNELFND